MNINNIKLKINKLVNTGFFSIFMGTVFSKVIAFLGNIIVVRVLSKQDYGVYAYAINAMTMLYIFNDFGASNAALQSLTEAKDDKEKQKLILKYALSVGIKGSIFSGILILLSPLFYPFEITEAKYYTPILFLIPLFSNVNSFISVLLRANLKNTKYAILEFTKTFFNYLFLIILSSKFGIKGAIISQYCYTFIGLLLGILLSKNILGKFNKKDSLSKQEKKSFIKYSLSTQLNSTLNSILLNVDIFLIGIMIANSDAVATYKVATTIPMALAFLPTCVMIYILPHFVINNKNIEWIKRNYKRLIKIGGLVYGFLSVLLIAFSPIIFDVLYGNQYDNAVFAFRILIIGFFFNATFRIPTNNILYSMRKLKINLTVTIISVILNCLSNVIFINYFGMNGAAMTTAGINIISSIILVVYVKKILKEGKNE